MRLPHIIPFAKSPLYFFTACTASREPLLASTLAMEVLTDIWHRSADSDGWYVGRFVLMPDHVHFFARCAPNAKPRGLWTKMWKSVTARRLIDGFGGVAPVWQSDTFDHVVRSTESYQEKWNYVRLNPVRAGLCARIEDWPWQGEVNSLPYE